MTSSNQYNWNSTVTLANFVKTILLELRNPSEIHGGNRDVGPSVVWNQETLACIAYLCFPENM